MSAIGLTGAYWGHSYTLVVPLGVILLARSAEMPVHASRCTLQGVLSSLGLAATILAALIGYVPQDFARVLTENHHALTRMREHAAVIDRMLEIILDHMKFGNIDRMRPGRLLRWAAMP